MEVSPPLNYEASAGSTHLSSSAQLPAEVVQCLQNARFLHLATCTDRIPHVSLMNYTYFPSTPFSRSPIIVMTTNPASKKTANLITNPNVSLLVHDWVSHRPPTARRGSQATTSNRGGSPPPPDTGRSSLAALLLNLNTSAISSISSTINGEARMVERGTEEEKYLREAHLENNTFGEDGDEAHGAERRNLWGETLGTNRNRSTTGNGDGDGGREIFIEDEDVRVVVVEISDGRVADWKGGVRDWVLTGRNGNTENNVERLVNGI